MTKDFIREGIPRKITREDVDGVHIKYIKNTYDRYAVSDEGYIYSFSDKCGGKIIGTIFLNGYVSTIITQPFTNKQKHVYVHRAVAEEFLQPVPGKNQLHHINEDRLDNRVCNLMYCTGKENCNAGNHNTKLSKSVAKYYKNHENAKVALGKKVAILDNSNNIIHVVNSIYKASKFIEEKTGKNINATRNQISNILNGKSGFNTVGGFKVREATDEEYNQFILTKKS